MLVTISSFPNSVIVGFMVYHFVLPISCSVGSLSILCQGFEPEPTEYIGSGSSA